MPKTFFKLKGAYEGLEARRLQWSGRLVLYQIFNDGPAPYWLVQIQGFNPVKDRAGDLIDPAKNNTWRFTDLPSAILKYEQLAPFFPPRIYKVPLNTAARMAELRARKGKSLRRTEQGTVAGQFTSQDFQEPVTPVEKYITEVMEAACN